MEEREWKSGSQTVRASLNWARMSMICSIVGRSLGLGCVIFRIRLAMSEAKRQNQSVSTRNLLISKLDFAKSGVREWTILSGSMPISRKVSKTKSFREIMFSSTLCKFYYCSLIIPEWYVIAFWTLAKSIVCHLDKSDNFCSLEGVWIGLLVN